MNIRCKMLGHAYKSQEAKERGYCSRCEFEHADEWAGLLLPSTYRQMIAFHLAAHYCRWRGHKWVDVSVAGADGGDVAVECSRCGETHRTVLY